jgi:hypothetical protein
MADDLSGYFELAAQVIPVLLLALVIESGFLPQLRREVVRLRGPAQYAWIHNSTDDPLVVEALSQFGITPEDLRADPGRIHHLNQHLRASMHGDHIALELWFVPPPTLRSRLATLAIDTALVAAIVGEAIALACVAFDIPRLWQQFLGAVVLVSIAALLVLTLLALRRLMVARGTANAAVATDNAVDEQPSS